MCVCVCVCVKPLIHLLIIVVVRNKNNVVIKICRRKRDASLLYNAQICWYRSEQVSPSNLETNLIKINSLSSGLFFRFSNSILLALLNTLE